MLVTPARGSHPREYVMLEQRYGTMGLETVQVPMVEITSEELRRAPDNELDRFLEELLGITARKFWSRAKKISHLLSAASLILDQDEP
jgi:hypothetical protein